MKNLFGLIGFPLGHSFSQRYFREKFQTLGIQSDYDYELFELQKLDQAFPKLLKRHPNLRGLNVTIPHKQHVIPFLDHLTPEAERIGAVNTIKIHSDGKKVGYNTDYIGFRESLMKLLVGSPTTSGVFPKALVLGTGGAAQAVRVALEDMKIPFVWVSRKGNRELHERPVLSYDAVSAEVLQNYSLLINTTPLGMSPKVESRPNLPYEALTTTHYLMDLVYNPLETSFLKAGKVQGTRTKNGLEMLEKQAEAAWQIWTNEKL